MSVFEMKLPDVGEGLNLRFQYYVQKLAKDGTVPRTRTAMVDNRASDFMFFSL